MYLVTNELPFFTSKHRIEEVQADRGTDGWEFVKEADEAVQHSSNLSGLKQKRGKSRRREKEQT